MDQSMHMGHHEMMNHSMTNTTSMHQNIVATSMGMDGMDNGHDMHDMPGMMKMYFHFGEVAQILFKGWKTETALALFFSCLGLFFLALIYEGLKVFREELMHRQFVQSQASTDSVTSASEASRAGFVSATSYNLRKNLFNPFHLFQSLLQIIQVTLSYTLMLVFMTFNVWLCLAVVLGSGVGYFLFCWRRQVYFSSTEHCH